MSVRFLHGHVLDQLAALPERSIHCVVTSPPYWGLRDYGLEPVVWDDPGDCAHAWGKDGLGRVGRKDGGRDIGGRGGNYQGSGPHVRPISQGAFCQHCHAWRGSLGLEPTVGGYVTHLVQVFAAVWRVLRDDGTLWLNLSSGYHEKQLLGLEWRTAFALQAAGWILRSDIIWSKLNPMPESVQDRPTRSHEYLFLLTKQERYYYDNIAIAEETGGLSPISRDQKGTSQPNKAQPFREAQSHTESLFTNGESETLSIGISPIREAKSGAEEILRLGERKDDNPSLPSNSERESIARPWGPQAPGHDANRKHADGNTMASHQNQSEESLLLLQTPDATPHNGSCNSPQQGGASCREQHRSIMPQLQQHQGEQNSHAHLRNKRSVWTIAIAPFAEAHFAAFPPALVEPCLKAGTSEQGCCASCGAPWVRIMEHKAQPNAFGAGGGPKAEVSEATRLRGGFGRMDGGRRAVPGSSFHNNPAKRQGPGPTLGWRPSCRHEMPMVPCTILDPFCGAGTTLLVAQRLGRDAIGIDLNATYLDLARRRVSADMPLFYEEPPDPQRPLST
jgi:DNA modification methylase